MAIEAIVRTCLVAAVIGSFGPAVASAQSIDFGPPIEVSTPVFLPRPGPVVAGITAVGGAFLAYDDSEGIRLAADGSAIDADTFRMPGTQQLPCSSSVCLSVRLSSPTAGSATAQRIQPDGTLVDSSPLVLAPATAVVAAWNGTSFLVVWLERTAGQLQWTHVRPDGSRVEAAPVTRDRPTGGYERPVGLACGTAECLLAYETLGEVRALRITPSATLDPDGFYVMPSQTSATSDVTFQGDWYLVQHGSRGIRVRSDATFADAAPFSLRQSAFEGDACTATGCLLIVGRGADLLRPDGTITSCPAFVPSVTGRRLSGGQIACDAAICLAAFRDLDTDIMIVRPVTHDGMVIGADEVIPVRMAATQRASGLAAGATGFLAAWSEGLASPTEYARGGRVAGDVALDAATPIELDDAGGADEVAFGSGVFMAIVGNDSVRRVAADGSTPDAAPIRLSAGVDPVPHAIDFDGRNFLVVGYSGTRRELAVRRVSPVGATLEPSWVPIEPGVRSDAAVAFDGTNHLVVWSEFRTSRGREIYGRRIAQDGSVLDALSIAIGSADGDQDVPSLAFGGGRYLVAWLSRDDETIWATRVEPDGTVLDATGIRVSEVGSGPSYPHVAWDGSSFCVAWSETERIEDPPGSGVFRTEHHGAATRIDLTGVRVDVPPARFALTGGSLNGIAAGPGGVAVVYQEPVAALLDQSRVFVRSLRTGAAAGDTCADASECASRVCIDSICCDRACGGECEACTVARGASADGTCSVLSLRSICRAASGGLCDVDEVCDGVASACPPDEPMAGCSGDAGMTMPDDDGGVTLPGDDAGGAPDDAGPAPGSDGGVAPARDGGSSVDAGPALGDPGCSCRGVSTRGPTPVSVLLLFGLVGLLHRRR